MNRKILVTAIGLLSIGVASSALAQETKPVGLSLRGGIFFPSSSFSKDIGKQWFAAGAEYRLKEQSLGMPGSNADLSISVDWYGKDNDSTVPVLLNFTGHNNEFYYTAGAGFGMNRQPAAGGGTDSKTKLAYQFGIGYNFQQGRSPLFVEARYWGNSESDLNGIAVYLGIRL